MWTKSVLSMRFFTRNQGLQVEWEWEREAEAPLLINLESIERSGSDDNNIYESELAQIEGVIEDAVNSKEAEMKHTKSKTRGR